MAPKRKQVQAEEASSDSEYEVEQYVRPAKAQKLEETAESESEEDVDQPTNEANAEDSGDDSDSSDLDHLPGLTKDQLESIRETLRYKKRFVLNIANLNRGTSKDEIAEHFSQAGRVKAIRIPKFRNSGFAFVEMLDPEGFQRAFLLHNSVLDGRKIQVRLSEAGHKKTENKKKALKKKNKELLMLRKRNKNKPEEEVGTLEKLPKEPIVVAPKLSKKAKKMDKPNKKKIPSKKEVKLYNKKKSMKAKMKNMAQANMNMKFN
jgi:nucleolar protein 6